MAAHPADSVNYMRDVSVQCCADPRCGAHNSILVSLRLRLCSLATPLLLLGAWHQAAAAPTLQPTHIIPQEPVHTSCRRAVHTAGFGLVHHTVSSQNRTMVLDALVNKQGRSSQQMDTATPQSQLVSTPPFSHEGPSPHRVYAREIVVRTNAQMAHEGSTCSALTAEGGKAD